jgi:hypothetical protein
MKTNIYFRSYLAQFFLEWKIFQREVVEKLETHSLCSMTLFQKSCRLGDHVEKYCRAGQPQMIWRMRMACWIPKARNAYTGCVILIAFPLQQWLHERASMLCYTFWTLPVLFLFTARHRSALIVRNGSPRKPTPPEISCLNYSSFKADYGIYWCLKMWHVWGQ